MKVEKIDNNKLRISDDNVDCVFSNGKISGKGSRKHKSEIQKAISDYEIKEGLELASGVYDSTKEDYRELASLSSLINSFNSSNVRRTAVTLEEIELWQSNPIKYAYELNRYSIYLMGSEGVVARAYDLFVNLHGLSSSLDYTNANDPNFEKDMAEIKRYDTYMNKETIIRDILRSVVHGTCIGYIYRKKWLQVLDTELYTPTKLINGYWQVQCDLLKLTTAEDNKTIYDYPNTYQPENYAPNEELISRQPEEIQQAFRNWQKGDNTDRYYDIAVEKTIVIKHNALQQERFGRPFAMPAMDVLQHKQLLVQAEEILIDKIAHSVYILTMGEKGKESDGNFKPTPSQRKQVGTVVKDILNRKETSSSSDDELSEKIVGLPWWASIEKLSVDLSLFNSDKYEQVDEDIRVAMMVGQILGVSDSGSYASASVSIELFMKNIFPILEQIEDQLFNRQYAIMTSNMDNVFTRTFSRGTAVVGDTKTEILGKLLEKGGSIKFVLDEIGVNFNEYVSQVKAEKEMGLHELFEPYRTSSTLSNEGGRPNEGGDGAGNDNPKPSTE